MATTGNERIVKLTETKDLGELCDWQIPEGSGDHLSEMQKKPWTVEAEKFGESALALSFTRPDGKAVTVNCEIEDGNLRLHLFGPGQDIAQAHVTVTDNSAHVTPSERQEGATAVVVGPFGMIPYRGDEPKPAPWGQEQAATEGWAMLPAFDCAVRLEEGCLVMAYQNEDGTVDADNAVDVTDPGDQAFLDAVNEALGTNFKFDQFPGR